MSRVRTRSFEASAVLAIGLAFSYGVMHKRNPLNGFPKWTHWQWAWRNLHILRTAYILFIPFAIICWVLWRAEKTPPQSKPWGSLSLLALSNFLLQVLGMAADPSGLKMIGDIVMSNAATSYFTDATKIHGVIAWLRIFDHGDLGFHTSTHPPGPVLFYYVFVKLFSSHAAQIGGCAIGFIGSLGVFVIHKFASLWTNDPKARLTAAAFYALLPALTVFFPEFDQAYPILSMLLIFLWVEALNNSRVASVYLGGILFLASFFAYNLLTIGAFLAYYAVYWLWTKKGTPLTLLGAAGSALGVFTALHAILRQFTGFEAIASLRNALSNQAGYAEILKRTYVAFMLNDPYDFFLGAGIMALPLLIFHLRRSASDRAVTLIAVATILTIDLTGLLRGEAARVWLFLQPLIVVPVALELTSYPWPWRLAILATQWWVLVCLKARMSFVVP